MSARFLRNIAHARLVADGTNLRLYSCYDPVLVAAIKALPASARRYDPATKSWLIAAQHGHDVARIVEQTLGICLDVPTMANAAPPVTRLVRLDYLGQAKDRGDGNLTAYGYSNGDWRLLFPLATLKAWFCESSKPDEMPTLYGILGIGTLASINELKSAYRRAAKQWHPDVCSEPDATEQFKRIQAAYEILENPAKRARYDAGLQLAASATREPRTQSGPTWKPPLRCGMLLVEGTEQLGRLVVSRILQWQDIINAQGQTMVTSWRAGDEKPSVRWV